MSTKNNSDKPAVNASDLLPEGVTQDAAHRRNMMEQVFRKEEAILRKRKVATVTYWAVVIVLYAIPQVVIRCGATHLYRNVPLSVTWGASTIVFLVIAVASTVSLLTHRTRIRRIRDANILSTLHDINETLQKLSRDHDKS